MSFLQSIFTTIETDWHKFGIAFLVLKELKVAGHALNAFKNIKSFVKNIFTKTGRALIWAQIKNFFSELLN